MDLISAYLACAGGVVMSVLIPSLAKTVRQYFGSGTTAAQRERTALERYWLVLKPYALLGLLSLVVSVLIVAFVGEKLSTWQSALIAGYLWDSTLQKIAAT